jgi:hypothetical protein
MQPKRSLDDGTSCGLTMAMLLLLLLLLLLLPWPFLLHDQINSAAQESNPLP